MARQFAKVAAVFLALFFAIGTLSACAQIPKGMQTGADNANNTNAKEETKPGILDKLISTPEPTPPPPSNRDVFTEGLKQVLLNAVSQGDRLESLKFERLFDPTAEVDSTRSNITTMKIDLSDEKQENHITIGSETRHDAKSGDASYVLSASQGDETAQSGGAYFAGSDLYIKRGDADKKMVRFPIDQIYAASYKSLSPVDRLTRVFSGDLSIKKDKSAWEKSIDDYNATILSTAQDTDFSAGEETVSVLKKDQACPSVILVLKGEKAKTVLSGLLTLLDQDETIKQVLSSTKEDSDAEEGDVSEIETIQSDLDSLTGDEIAELELTMRTVQYDKVPIGVYLNYTMKGEASELGIMYYEHKLERDIQINLTISDGAMMTFQDQNISAGGDSYKGSLSAVAKEEGGKDRMSASVQTSSTNNGTDYTSDIQFKMTTYKYDKDGKQTTQEMSGAFHWSQKKDGEDKVSGKGTGDMTMGGSEDESTKLLTDITLEQTYGDVTVEVPQFIESAGIVANDRDSLFKALELDRKEYEDASVMQRALMTMFVLIG